MLEALFGHEFWHVRNQLTLVFTLSYNHCTDSLITQFYFGATIWTLNDPKAFVVKNLEMVLMGSVAWEAAAGERSVGQGNVP